MRLAQVTLTLALPYLVFIVGERVFAVSGVVAAVTAGLEMTAIGQPRFAPDDWRFLQEMWGAVGLLGEIIDLHIGFAVRASHAGTCRLARFDPARRALRGGIGGASDGVADCYAGC